MRLAALLGLAVLSATSATAQSPTRAVVTVSVSAKANGEFLEHAIVAIVGTRHIGRTDSAGRARLRDLDPGTHMLRVRALGYTQYNAVISVEGTDSVEVPVQLELHSQRLDPVYVRELATSPWLREFESRRLRATGQYVTGDEIRAQHGTTMNNLLMRHMRGVRVDNSDRVISMRGSNGFSGACHVLVYLDGVKVPGSNANEVPLSLIAGIEYYSPGTIPVQYKTPSPVSAASRGAARDGSAACGVMLLWTGP